jgi:hypothetical protein
MNQNKNKSKTEEDFESRSKDVFTSKSVASNNSSESKKLYKWHLW